MLTYMIYTDGIHLIADDVEELHVFAKEIGMKRRTFVDNKHKHYPVIGNQVTKAILAGATVTDTRSLVRLKLNADIRKNALKMLG